ncbi:MAG: ATP-binding protein, partial [Opitutae bacterium]|nr:ATP-binding protein [Opitutae bacterium]
IAAQLARHPTKAGDAETAESLANIHSVFRILEVRAEETLLHAREPGRWIDYGLDELRADFQAVFAAIEKNSKGRYRIIYNLARQLPSDYYIDFVIDSANGRTVAMPLLFKDVMRDLIANARKYTAVGGTINVGVYETERELRFVVQDTGRGIPPGELELVVHFGRRASNAMDVRTMGGGFGLTKAFLVTKRFGGRFWIKSGLGVGTRITIVIPRPAAAAG